MAQQEQQMCCAHEELLHSTPLRVVRSATDVSGWKRQLYQELTSKAYPGGNMPFPGGNTSEGGSYGHDEY